MEEFLKTLPGLGIGGILALFIYIQSRKDSESHTEVVKGYHEQEKGRTEMLVQVVKENTVAITKNTSVVESFHTRLDDERETRT